MRRPPGNRLRGRPSGQNCPGRMPAHMTPNRIAIACLMLVLGFGLSACTGAATQGEGRATAQPGRVRAYFIAADEVTWDYVHGCRQSDANRRDVACADGDAGGGHDA